MDLVGTHGDESVDREWALRLADDKCSRARDVRRNLAVAIGVVGVLFAGGSPKTRRTGPFRGSWRISIRGACR